MTAQRTLRQIVSTTDVHSTLGNAVPFLSRLHALRPSSLVVDCGDFFEGSGYYRLAHGSIEREILLKLYDVLAPGNHGWAHHFEPELRRLTVCANAVDAHTGEALFRRLHTTCIAGRRIGITAVIGQQAFHTIPAAQRADHRVTDPVQALREVMLAHHHEVDDWILLSHSGFDEDVKLAAACPFLDVIFAGHCHSDQYGPVRVGDTLIVKGRERADGYAVATPVGQGWGAGTTRFPDRAPAFVPTELAPLEAKIGAVRRQLTAVLGPVVKAYRHRTLDRHDLLVTLVARLRSGLGVDAVILNETALRSVPLDDTLTLGDLLTVDPFDNQLIHAHVPEDFRHDLHGLTAYLTKQCGPLVTAPDPLSDGITTVLTTDYLADTYLADRTHAAGLLLSQAVKHVLTAPPANGDTP
ncbi:bifunctional metallophosphatase/5'-nucleotidase [Streptomyces canus]|uniref:bifunctional metallophosphatase/5'-nucleotidase n=1 Tax=Streptomyces canus TaxID=58343 RepID=UPI00225B057D|nr:bifunctional metallophosphatase/5'-nucleotidase [Streptomyces canus]MCX4856121.1 bifunctional metallophosphatase/5'-nucleotidase [Streptomyces canus]WSW38399.1 bifunctional metallophosphatase/5'-nucleotidase [Streptomyces canus]